MFLFAADPCDGTCHYNPSGLFADPDHSNHFIQCGCAFRGNVPCTCCQKFFLPCAPASYFDDHKKVCVRKHHWEDLNTSHLIRNWPCVWCRHMLVFKMLDLVETIKQGMSHVIMWMDVNVKQLISCKRIYLTWRAVVCRGWQHPI